MKKNKQKLYTSPVLKKFGAVAKLTMKLGSGASDGTGTQQDPIAPPPTVS